MNKQNTILCGLIMVTSFTGLCVFLSTKHYLYSNVGFIIVVISSLIAVVLLYMRSLPIIEKIVGSTNCQSDSVLKQSFQLANYLSIKGFQPEMFGESLKFKYMNRTILVMEQNGLLSLELHLPFREFYNAMEKTRNAVQHYMQSVAVEDELVCCVTVPVSANMESTFESILETKIRRCVCLYEELALLPFREMCRTTVRMMIQQFLYEAGELNIDVFKKDCPNPFRMELALAYSDYLSAVYAIRFRPENINSEVHPKLDTIVKVLAVYVNQDTPYILSKRIMNVLP